MTTVYVDYGGLDPDVATSSEPEDIELMAAIKKAVDNSPLDLTWGIDPRNEHYWSIYHDNGNIYDMHMFVLYDDCTMVSYEPGTEWAILSETILDILDDYAMANWNEHIRDEDN